MSAQVYGPLQYFCTKCNIALPTGQAGYCARCADEAYSNRLAEILATPNEALAALAAREAGGSDPKETNPKAAVGVAKVPCSTVPQTVMAEVGLAMLEGALKYGRHNYRESGARASVYYDAVVQRHLAGWWEGEDIDKDSGLSHITKAIAGLVVLRDAMIIGLFTDDRPPKAPAGWIEALNAKAKALIEKYPDPKPAHTELSVRAKAKKENA